MLGLWLKVARPADWRGRCAWLGMVLVTGLFLLAAAAGKLPSTWTVYAGSRAWFVRAVLMVGVLVGGSTLSRLAYAAIPASAVTVWGRVRFRVRGRQVYLRRREIVDVAVQRRPRPAGEVLVVTDRSGRCFDICPLHWPGAGQIYRKLQSWADAA